jgi:glyoxylase-like metal-dependent hydrolase (beta-lactamase superfamily II)
MPFPRVAELPPPLIQPGHTSGHSSLVVRLKSGKNFVLTGDAAHFHETYESNGVPSFNYDRAQTVASMERIKKIAARTSTRP